MKGRAWGVEEMSRLEREVLRYLGTLRMEGGSQANIIQLSLDKIALELGSNPRDVRWAVCRLWMPFRAISFLLDSNGTTDFSRIAGLGPRGEELLRELLEDEQD